MLKEGSVLFSFRRLLEPLCAAIGLKGGKQKSKDLHPNSLLVASAVGTETREDSAVVQSVFVTQSPIIYLFVKVLFVDVQS